MGPPWNARFVAKVLGIPAVMLGGIFAFPWLASVVLSASGPDGLKYLIIALFAVPVLGAIAVRMCRGGEQGPTDIILQETPTARTITITNVHLAGGPASRALDTFERMPPVPRPVGIVTGNPSVQADLVVDATAELPDHVPVSDEPLALPQGTQGLAVNPPGDEVKTTDAVDVKIGADEKQDA